MRRSTRRPRLAPQRSRAADQGNGRGEGWQQQGEDEKLTLSVSVLLFHSPEPDDLIEP
jgi:hypothetical protein